MDFVYIWTTSSWLTQIWKSQRFPPHVFRSTEQMRYNQARAYRKQEASHVCTTFLYVQLLHHTLYVLELLHTCCYS